MRRAHHTSEDPLIAASDTQRTSRGVDVYRDCYAAEHGEHAGINQCGANIICRCPDAHPIEPSLRVRDRDRHDDADQGKDDQYLRQRQAGDRATWWLGLLHPADCLATGSRITPNERASLPGHAGTRSWRRIFTASKPPAMSRFLRALLVVALSGCRDPRAEANIAQAMTEVGTTLTLLQQDYALLQGEVDSLRRVVAQQDTIIRRLASMAGLPVPPR